MNDLHSGYRLSNSRWADYDPEHSAFPPPAPLPYASVPELFLAQKEEMGKKTIFTFRERTDREWTVRSWEEAAGELRALVRFFAEACALSRGEKVLFLGPAGRASVLLDIAVQQAGGTPLLLDPEVEAPALGDILLREMPRVLLAASLTHAELLREHGAALAQNNQRLQVILTDETMPPEHGLQNVEFYDYEELAQGPPAALEVLAAPTEGLSAVHYINHGGALTPLVVSQKGALSLADAVLHSALLGNGENVMQALPHSLAGARLFTIAALAVGGSITFPTGGATQQMPSSAGIAELFSDLRNSHPRLLLSRSDTLNRLCSAFQSQEIRRKSWTKEVLEPKEETTGLLAPLRRAFHTYLRQRLRSSLFGTRMERCLAAAPPAVEESTRTLCTRLGVPLYEGLLCPQTGLPISWNTERWSKPGTLGRPFGGIALQEGSYPSFPGISLNGASVPFEFRADGDNYLSEA